MSKPAWRSHPLWTLVASPLLFSIPFALFFMVIQAAPWQAFPLFFAASCVYSFVINTTIKAVTRWVAPRFLRSRDEATSGPGVAHIALYATASIVASVVSALILHFTFVPNMLGSPQRVIMLLVFAALFTTLFLAIIYAMRYKDHLIDRVRTEAEREAREAHEMRVAAEIQQALLPPRSRSDTWYAAAGASIPCRTIGGDFFEYFDLPDQRVGFALADVAGKGPPAALLAAMVQGIFDSHARMGDGPAKTLARVNEALAAREIEARFATVFYAVLGPRGEFAYSNAGHNPPVVLRRRNIVRRLDTGGLMIGPFKDARFEEGVGTLEPGDVLVVYSDGVTDAEAEDGEQFGEERLLACLEGPLEENPEAVRDRVLQAVRTFAGTRPPADDVTVMVVRYSGLPVASRPTS